VQLIVHCASTYRNRSLSVVSADLQSMCVAFDVVHEFILTSCEALSV
jgi:hypothetical protein